MAKVILVKHAKPQMDPKSDACVWRLSSEGREAALRLGVRLTTYAPDLLLSSTEPKAEETAAAMGERLGLAHESVPGLQEHDRRGVGWLSNQEFQESARRFFEHPSEIVYGNESADEAHFRFHNALAAALKGNRFETAVIVTHGTVISLYLERTLQVEPFPLWRSLKLPSYVVVDWPEPALMEVVASIPS